MPKTPLILLLSFLFTVSCSERMEMIVLSVDGQAFRTEVARTEAQRQLGLMNRASLDNDAAMLFVFERESQLSFWMKNTTIPLDIAFIGRDGRIRELRSMRPLSLDPIVAEHSVLYALEVNRGAFASRGIEVGDSVVFPEGFLP